MTIHHQDDWLTIHSGDCRAVLATMPERSVHCVVTSPPYWGLRDYGTATWDGGDAACDHRQGRPGAGRADGIVDDRAQRNRDGAGAMGGDCKRCGATRIDAQLGLEPTPEAYVANMVAVFREVHRVLRDDGTLWLNLGDSFMPGKQMAGIPWRVAFALQADGWVLRSDIVWAKPNPMPESVTDRPTKSHEYLFLLTKAERYYFDADAVREAQAYPLSPDARTSGGYQRDSGRNDGSEHRSGGFVNNQSGRNIRSVWTIATAPYPGAHFATFPPKLVEPCIKAGSPVGGVVLDPFGGSGTTAMVAQSLSRRAILIDLNPEYLDQQLRRNTAMPLGLS